MDGELIKRTFLRYMRQKSILTSTREDYYSFARYLMLVVNIPAHLTSLGLSKYKQPPEQRPAPHSQVKYTVNDATVSNNVKYIKGMTIWTTSLHCILWSDYANT
ncbi:MAG: hypothetical protein Q8M40_02345 [Legionella sp.]|nr:hypothetical protein [Legionella sp.]